MARPANHLTVAGQLVVMQQPPQSTFTSDSPRDIYAAACAEIGSHFTDQGYRFAKSDPHVSRKSDPFRFEIAFQSSFRNVRGAVVKLWVSGSVYSKQLEKWRCAQPRITNTDYVAGGQIGNLVNETIASDWNLADPHSRHDTISNIIAAIESVVLPYFSQFDDVSTLSDAMLNRDIPSMTIDRVIEFLMCFADAETARVAAVNFLQRRPNLVRSYARDYQRYAERGLDWSHASGYARQLAFASHLFEFGDLTLKGA
jgi:hypothetical protein